MPSFKELSGSRIGIRPLAQKIASVGLESPADIPKDIQAKVELYALSVAIIHRVVKRALSKRGEHPPFGLVEDKGSGFCNVTSLEESVPGVDSYGHLMEYFDATLKMAMRYELDKAKTTVSGMNAPWTAYERFQALVASERDLVANDEDRFISRGIGTAVRFMSATLRVIPQVYIREFASQPSADELIEIAKDSYAFISMVANMHIKAFNDMNSELAPKNRKGIDHINPDYLSMVNKLGRRRLDFKPEFLLRISEIVSKGVAASHDPAIGCPARVKVDERSALFGLWHWFLVPGAEIYRQKYPVARQST